MIRYMLDTNICIHLIKYRPTSVLKKLSSIPIDEVGVSSIVYAELCYGVAYSQKKKKTKPPWRIFCIMPGCWTGQKRPAQSTE